MGLAGLRRLSGRTTVGDDCSGGGGAEDGGFGVGGGSDKVWR